MKDYSSLTWTRKNRIVWDFMQTFKNSIFIKQYNRENGESQ